MRFKARPFSLARQDATTLSYDSISYIRRDRYIAGVSNPHLSRTRRKRNGDGVGF